MEEASDKKEENIEPETSEKLETEKPVDLVDKKSIKFQDYLESIGLTRVLIWGLVIGLIIGGSIAYNVRPNTAAPTVTKTEVINQKSSTGQPSTTSTQTISKDELKEKTKSYILTNMVRPGTLVEINNIEEDKGMYKLDLTLSFQDQVQDVESYATKDGALFFPSYMDLNMPIETPPIATPSATPSGTTQTLPQIQTSASKLIDDDPSTGPSDAQVTIVEFSDFQCPFCARSAATIHQIIDTYGDKVRIVYRDFPLTNIHPDAQKAAEAAECADDQGKFWEFHDKIFENQANIGVNNLKQFAKDLGLDTKKFDECLDSGIYEEEVKKDMQDGIDAGVTSTPTFFVNNEKVIGAKPFSGFKEIIDAELSSGSGAGSVLPTYATTNAVVEQAYVIATEIPEVLEKIPCYCSCGGIGHDSLKECFISENGEFADHASVCDICINEALDVDTWYKAGVPIEEIRSRIDEKYKQYGEPTNTPT